MAQFTDESRIPHGIAISKLLALILALAAVCGPWKPARCEDRTFEENGVLYKEVRRTVKRPVATVRNETKKVTTYKHDYTTEMQEVNHTVWVPVTQYRWESFHYPRLNLFSPVGTGWRMVPEVRFAPQAASTRYPVTRRELVPETRTIEVPKRSLGFVEREETSRIALGPAARQRSRTVTSEPHPLRPEAIVADRRNDMGAVGGVSRVQNDPPRHGWRAIDATRRY